MKKVFDSVSPEDRRLRLLVMGLNPALGYGNGQDRFVEGALNLSGFGFRGLVKRGDLKVDGKSVATAGRPSISSSGKLLPLGSPWRPNPDNGELSLAV